MDTKLSPFKADDHYVITDGIVIHKLRGWCITDGRGRAYAPDPGWLREAWETESEAKAAISALEGNPDSLEGWRAIHSSKKEASAVVDANYRLMTSLVMDQLGEGAKEEKELARALQVRVSTVYAIVNALIHDGVVRVVSSSFVDVFKSEYVYALEE